jgi:hypothetical protein
VNSDSGVRAALSCTPRRPGWGRASAWAPRAKWDRLFWYPGGIAQRLTTEPEPKILRWAGVTAVRAHLESFLAEAERVVAIELMPGLSYQPLRPRIHGNCWINLDGISNGVLARHVIEHAAAPCRMPVELRRE